VARARAAYERRPSIYAADALAWALYKNGELAEAKQYSIKALQLNTQDALLHFHAGMIARAAGDAKAAKQHLQMALQINPYFSVRYAPQAKAALKQLN
jgi:tetratricopeptide (TPR) repeat protein